MKAMFHSWQGSETGSSTLCERESESNKIYSTKLDGIWTGVGMASTDLVFSNQLR